MKTPKITPIKSANATETVTSLELLAPARDADTAIAAINHGADAVYMGASGFGARHQASNSVADVARVVEYAHTFGVKVYVTVNTLVYEEETEEVRRLVWELWRIGVDALIVQDMSLLRMHLPPIALHASTQCDIRTPEKAAMLQAAGFSQLVLPRELSLEEIRAMHEAVDVPLESFVHGALCVSYSGDCQASFVLTGRSANRGECAQICRYSFDLEDGAGNKLIRGKHLLSLRDMNRLEMLEDMIDAGVRSFKIEGRLKDPGYVKNVVAAYSRELDRICAASGGRLRRSSLGKAEGGFAPQLTKSFNRGFTSYFLKDTQPAQGSLASFDTPKWIGEPVGTVIAQKDNRTIIAKLTSELHNGDGLGYFDPEGRFTGFRLNRVEGNRLYAASDVAVRRGTQLYRNADTEWEQTVGRSEGVRKIDVEMTLRSLGDRIALEIYEPVTGLRVEQTADCPEQTARTPQEEPRRRVLAKLGDTPYRLAGVTDRLGDRFVPSSVLTQLRRDAVETFSQCRAATYRTDLRRKDDPEALHRLTPAAMTRHDNVANSLAEEFYRQECKVEGEMPKAIEVDGIGSDGDRRVMQTRYCLRRELGACLRTAEGGKYPKQLYLSTPSARLRLEFDCRRCIMNIYAEGESKALSR